MLPSARTSPPREPHDETGAAWLSQNNEKLILVAGGTGTLGTHVVRLLTARGLEVCVMTRDSRRAGHLRGNLVTVVEGDVRDPYSVRNGARGAEAVVSLIHGFTGTDAGGPRAVDGEGNSNLIRAAESAGAEQFVMMSVRGASPDHPMELHRMKFQAEQELRASRLAWTIVRATAFMETYVPLICEPLLRRGRTQVFGRGDNPINFVSVEDVARFIDVAVLDPYLRGRIVEVGGPANLTFNQMTQIFGRVTGRTVRVAHIPVPLLKLVSRLLHPVRPELARLIQAAVVMDTTDMSFDPSALRRRYPHIPSTTVAEMTRRDYVEDAVTAG